MPTFVKMYFVKNVFCEVNKQLFFLIVTSGQVVVDNTFVDAMMSG